MVKKVALGSSERERTEKRTSRGNRVEYWKRLMRQAEIEDDNAENLKKKERDGKGW